MQRYSLKEDNVSPEGGPNLLQETNNNHVMKNRSSSNMDTDVEDADMDPYIHPRKRNNSNGSGSQPNPNPNPNPHPHSAEGPPEVRESMCFDITEELWFANERNGSLDEETFETIQKQLLSRETMYEKGAIGTPGSSPSLFPGHRCYSLN